MSQNKNSVLLDEVWLVACKQKNGEFPDSSKVIGMSYSEGITNNRWGERVFFNSPEKAEAFLNKIDIEMRKYFGIFKAYINVIKEEQLVLNNEA